MGWEAWALDHLWLVAGGSLVVSLLLHFVVTWFFKNSGQKPDHATVDEPENKS